MVGVVWFGRSGETQRPSEAWPRAQRPAAYFTGVNSGRWDDHTLPASDMAQLRAKTVRVGVDIGTSTESMDRVIAKYHAKGVRILLLAEFFGRVPSTREARSVAIWARRYGPAGSYWKGRRRPQPVMWIEFGNETSSAYQFDDDSDAAYRTRAGAYARRLRDARAAMVAIGGAAAAVGLLAQTDPDVRWAAGMLAAVPDLDAHVAGWTAHPYGPLATITHKLDAAIGSLTEAGATVNASRPLFVTEYGIASDGGRRLRDNYGWPRDLDYGSAASNLLAAEAKLRRDYGGRLRLFIVYSARDLREPGASSSSEDYFGALKRNRYRRGVSSEKGAMTRAVRRLMVRGA